MKPVVLYVLVCFASSCALGPGLGPAALARADSVATRTDADCRREGSESAETVVSTGGNLLWGLLGGL